jgi:hypothetical protein
LRVCVRVRRLADETGARKGGDIPHGAIGQGGLLHTPEGESAAREARIHWTNSRTGCLVCVAGPRILIFPKRGDIMSKKLEFLLAVLAAWALRNYLKTAAQHVIASGAKQSLSHAWA